MFQFWTFSGKYDNYDIIQDIGYKNIKTSALEYLYFNTHNHYMHVSTIFILALFQKNSF